MDTHGIRRRTAVGLVVQASVVVALMFATAAPAIAAKPSHGGGGGGGGSGSTTTGYDISYPQCGTSFPSSTAFGIVGVNGGLASDLNPCLGPASSYTQSELYWAVAHEGKLYMATVLDLFSRRLLACPTSEHRLSLHSLSRAQRPLATPSPVVRDEEAAGKMLSPEQTGKAEFPWICYCLSAMTLVSSFNRSATRWRDPDGESAAPRRSFRSRTYVKGSIGPKGPSPVIVTV